QLQQELGAKQGVERERAELVARLGAREKALRDEEQLRRDDVAEIARLRERVAALEEERRGLDPARTQGLADENQRLRDRVRSLERAADRAARVAELEDELAALRAAHEQAARAADARAADVAEQLRVLQARERAALHRVDELREQLHDARVLLARGDAPARSQTGRVGVFIDEANLSASARRDLDSRLDYRALLEALVGDRPRACAVAFVVDAPETPPAKHHAFVARLREQGWDVREKRAKVRADGSRKADWDMGIAMEILDVVDDLDVVVLGSGDGDFLPLVKRLRRLGRRVEVAAFRASTDESLVGGCDAFLGLDGRFRLPR
ncbi:MAG: NYN domain-containing protein, partial [Deltaproteobacteria bacterium]|nr:NYN domain-containing protein [Deltaproteobacteria bacterium]